jgi:ribonuclease HII
VKKTPNDFEHDAWAKGKYLLVIDEAGRGPLAGPLTVAGVIFEPGYENPDIYDSKGLSEKKRDALYETIMEDALWFADKECTMPPQGPSGERYNIVEIAYDPDAGIWRVILQYSQNIDGDQIIYINDDGITVRMVTLEEKLS